MAGRRNGSSLELTAFPGMTGVQERPLVIVPGLEPRHYDAFVTRRNTGVMLP